MHLTEEKRGLYVQVLRIAKNYVKDNTHVTLLNAVCRVLAGAITQPMKDACDDIAKHITDILNENTNLEQWLFIEKGIDVFEECPNPPCDEEYVRLRLQATYLAWADYLSEHLDDIPKKVPLAKEDEDELASLLGTDDADDDFKLEDII